MANPKQSETCPDVSLLAADKTKEMDGQVKMEENSIVFSFIHQEEWNRKNVLKMKDFLYEMGRQAKQGAVGLYIMGRYLEIPAVSYEQEK